MNIYLRWLKLHSKLCKIIWRWNQSWNQDMTKLNFKPNENLNCFDIESVRNDLEFNVMYVIWVKWKSQIKSFGLTLKAFEYKPKMIQPLRGKTLDSFQTCFQIEIVSYYFRLLSIKKTIGFQSTQLPLYQPCFIHTHASKMVRISLLRFNSGILFQAIHAISQRT